MFTFTSHQGRNIFIFSVRFNWVSWSHFYLRKKCSVIKIIETFPGVVYSECYYYYLYYCHYYYHTCQVKPRAVSFSSTSVYIAIQKLELKNTYHFVLVFTIMCTHFKQLEMNWNRRNKTENVWMITQCTGLCSCNRLPSQIQSSPVKITVQHSAIYLG